nr:MAG TPA: hypothetical protein [Caudoviricetes sp.]
MILSMRRLHQAAVSRSRPQWACEAHRQSALSPAAAAICPPPARRPPGTPSRRDG